METKTKVLIVEDDEINALITKRYIEKGNFSISAIVSNGDDAIKEVENSPPDVILMDIKIKGDKDGIETSEVINQKFNIPIIYLTAFSDEVILERAKATRPYGYIVKPIDAKTLITTIELAIYKHKATKADEDLNRVLQDTVEALATTLEFRDPYTAGHQQRVAKLAVRIAEELKLDQQNVECIRIAGLLHDLGKIKIPAEILAYPGKLDRTEFELIKKHSLHGYELLKNISFRWPVAQIVLQHHERIDGSGYPYGIKGDEIFIEAKVICVADVVEAMSSHRPYRPALGIDIAIDEISKKKGIIYDTEIVNACIEALSDSNFKLI